MEKRNAQVYISGALTNSSRKQFYEDIGKEVEKAGYTAYIPHIHTDPEKNADATPKEVYDVDMSQVDRSALMIAYVGYPSLGVGAELEHANNNGTPIILLYQEGEIVSRLALGIPVVKEIIKFHSEEEALLRLTEVLESL